MQPSLVLLPDACFEHAVTWILLRKAGQKIPSGDSPVCMGLCRLLWFCVVLGEAPCIATVFVTTFPQLLLTRAVTGVAVGGNYKSA